MSPMYEYFCHDCQKTFDKLILSPTEKDKKAECKCGRVVKRVMSANSFRLIGKWEKEGY